jgi:hypothetical protein
MTEILSKEFIDNLLCTDAKIIDGYINVISKEIAEEAKVLGINKARQNANLKYGKFWRERLAIKRINGSEQNNKWKLSYY